MGLDVEHGAIWGDLEVCDMWAGGTVVTMFDGEICGAGGHSFHTSKWTATDETDRQHWPLLPGFKVTAKGSLDANVDPWTSRYVFMRWKEDKLLHPESLSITGGVSFDGFYYVSYDKRERTFTALYYHEDTEWGQKLFLCSDDWRGQAAAYEMR